MPAQIAHRIDGVLGKAPDGVTAGFMVQVRAFAKNHPAYPYNNVNEHVCSSIGRLLGLPISPHGFVFHPGKPNELFFASLDFNPELANLPSPTDIPKLAQELPRLATGIILFDALVGNPDRHPGNLKMDASKPPTKLFVLDHGHALLGHEANHGLARLTSLEDRLACTGGTQTGQHRHCMIDALTTAEHLNDWIARIQAIPAFFISDLCQTAIDLGLSVPEARGVERFLLHRQKGFRELIANGKHEFSGIKEWGMFDV